MNYCLLFIIKEHVKAFTKLTYALIIVKNKIKQCLVYTMLYFLDYYELQLMLFVYLVCLYCFWFMLFYYLSIALCFYALFLHH